MHKIKAVIFVVFICVLSEAQAETTLTDSLRNELRKAPQAHTISDTTRMAILMHLGNYYQNVDSDSALFFHSGVINLATNLLDNRTRLTQLEIILLELKLGEAYRKAGWDNLLIGDYDLAKKQFSDGLFVIDKYRKFPNERIQKKGQELYSGLTFNMGTFYYVQSDYPRALEYYFTALSVNIEIENKKGQSANYANIGAVYYSQGDYPKALEYYFKALKMDEELGDKSGQSYNLGNIGIIYRIQGDYPKALEYYFRAQKIDEELGDKFGQAANLGNIGSVYKYQGEYEKALEYYFRALKLKEEIGDQRGQAMDYGNIGAVYFQQGNLSEALGYYMKALQLSEDLDDKETQANNLANIGELFTAMKRYQEAELSLEKGMALSVEINALDLTKTYYLYLSLLHEKTNKPQLALSEYKSYITLRDSIFNAENTKATIQKEIQFNYDKKASADSIAFAKEQEIINAKTEAQNAKNEAEITTRKNQQYALGSVLILAIVFGVFMYNRFKVTNRQKQIIEIQKHEVEKQKEYAEEQHHLVEEKNKEIMDSINYAKRIQAAILPPNRIVKAFLPDSFIFYKPKDIVAGDFYWLETATSQNHEPIVLFAAADCTGHGVPGAMVSVICNNGLNRSVREHGLTDPGKILDRTREIVIQEFEKSDDEVKDGMDISICAISALKLAWAGANNPIWIIKKNASEVFEIKADKQPIGKYSDPKPFTTHELELQKGDTIYIFTDGYQDQFGGQKGKKFKASSLKELFLAHQQKSMDQQKEILSNTFDSWRGNLEQIDDLCVIGVRI